MRKAVLIILMIMVDLINAQIVIDHNCWDISKIPAEYITRIKNEIKFSYRHRSHGEQLVKLGTEEMFKADPAYSYSAGWGLPSVANSFCIEDRASYYPGDYWQGAGKSNYIAELDHTPSLNVSGFMWCSDLYTMTAGDIDEYLSTMSEFEEMYSIGGAKNRKVYFVYFTSNNEFDQYTPANSYNKYLRNEQIRHWVKDHPEKNRILFDFADMDCWWFNPATQQWEMNTGSVTVNSTTYTIPAEHGSYVPGNYNTDPGHTTTENITHKGAALWYMMARILGWDGNAMPVELTSFSAGMDGKDVTLKWTTATEVNNLGFEVERSLDKTEWNKISFVQGHGNSTTQNEYSCIDRTPPRQTSIFYRLKQVNLDGSFEYSSVIETQAATLSDFRLEQNYPNPFNPGTVITYQVPEKCYARLVLYDALGGRISVLSEAVTEAGIHEYQFDSGKYGLSAGVYFYRLITDKFSQTKKMILIK